MDKRASMHSGEFRTDISFINDEYIDLIILSSNLDRQKKR